MREILPPDPVPVTSAAGKEVPYGLDAFLREFVLTDKRFRDEWASSFDVLVARFTLETVAVSRRTRAPIVICDEEYDRAKAILKAVELPTPLHVLLMPFFHCWTRARYRDDSTEAARSEPAASAAAS